MFQSLAVSLKGFPLHDMTWKGQLRHIAPRNVKRNVRKEINVDFGLMLDQETFAT